MSDIKAGQQKARTFDIVFSHNLSGLDTTTAAFQAADDLAAKIPHTGNKNARGKPLCALPDDEGKIEQGALAKALCPGCKAMSIIHKHIRVDGMDGKNPKASDIAGPWRRTIIKILKTKSFWQDGKIGGKYSQEFWDFLVALDQALIELQKLGKSIPAALEAAKEAHKAHVAKKAYKGPAAKQKAEQKALAAKQKAAAAAAAVAAAKAKDANPFELLSTPDGGDDDEKDEVPIAAAGAGGPVGATPKKPKSVWKVPDAPKKLKRATSDTTFDSHVGPTRLTLAHFLPDKDE
jgi:hypothetical protein